MLENYNKGRLFGITASFIVVAAIGALVFFKGEAMLFAITNESQVMAEKARWDAHIESYGQVQVGKAQ